MRVKVRKTERTHKSKKSWKSNDSMAKLSVAMRQHQITEMQLKGMHYKDIAEELGVSIQTVQRDGMKLTQFFKKKAVENIEIIKGQELMKLDLLERTLWEKFRFDQDTDHLKEIHSLVVTRSKLLGLFAPQKMQAQVYLRYSEQEILDLERQHGLVPPTFRLPTSNGEVDPDAPDHGVDSRNSFSTVDNVSSMAVQHRFPEFNGHNGSEGGPIPPES